MKRSRFSIVSLLATPIVAAMVLTGCSTPEVVESEPTAETTIKVGLLLPENQTARYEKFDRPWFEKAISENCANCEVLYANAGNDPAKQASQMESMIAEGASVIAIFPADGDALGASLEDAAARGVQTVIYGRPFKGPATVDMSIPLEELGAATAGPLAEKLAADGVTEGKIVFLNGDASYGGAVNIANGAKSALGDGFDYSSEFNVKNWDPAEAQKTMEQAITALGGENIVGVYAMNDGIAGGAIAALQGQGVDPLPPVVGMDQEISAIQRVLVGTQLSSSSTGPIEQAYAAGKVVAALAQGQTVEFDGTVDYGSGEINSINFQVPGSVTISQIQEVLLDRDVYTYDEICTADFKAACDAAGLKPRE